MVLPLALPTAGICGTDRSPSSVPGAFTAANRPKALPSFGDRPFSRDVRDLSLNRRDCSGGLSQGLRGLRLGAPQRPSHLIILPDGRASELQIQRFNSPVKL